MLKWRMSRSRKYHLISKTSNQYPECNDRPMNGTKQLGGPLIDFTADHERLLHTKNICKKCLASYLRYLERINGSQKQKEGIK